MVGECEGGCKYHSGKIMTVSITFKDHDCGIFHYCNNAVMGALKSGYKLIDLKHNKKEK